MTTNNKIHAMASLISATLRAIQVGSDLLEDSFWSAQAGQPINTAKVVNFTSTSLSLKHNIVQWHGEADTTSKRKNQAAPGAQCHTA